MEPIVLSTLEVVFEFVIINLIKNVILAQNLLILLFLAKVETFEYLLFVYYFVEAGVYGLEIGLELQAQCSSS